MFVFAETRDKIFIEDSDGSFQYINAVYVDGFFKSNKYIVTQQPLPNTENDFWKLVFQKECSIVISLNEIDLNDKVIK